MTRTPLTRGALARALELLGRAPARRPLPTKTEPIIADPPYVSSVSPEVDAHLVAVGERARPLHRRAR